MPVLKVNDINMYYETRGEGKTLVLIAGLGTGLEVYRPVIDRLSQKFKVLAFDNRGAGRTDKPDVPYSIEMMAGDTAALMSAVSFPKAHVLGISMGGRIALALALQHPDRVKSLVLASTAATGKKKSPFFFPRLVKLVRSKLSESQQPYYAFLHQLKASCSYDCSRRLDEINVPTLILHRKRDKHTSYKLAEEMHAGIKGSKIIAFNGGHLFFMWENKRFCDVVAEFLDGID